MIFMSASNVPANARETFGAHVKEAKYRLAEAAEDRNMRFAAIGVALDVDIEVGIEYLVEGTARNYSHYPVQDFGPWDEIHVGRYWFNDVVVRRIFRSDRTAGDIPLTGLPQILIVTRSVLNQPSWIRFGEERVQNRIIGRRALEEWLKARELLPADSSPQR